MENNIHDNALQCAVGVRLPPGPSRAEVRTRIALRFGGRGARASYILRRMLQLPGDMRQEDYARNRQHSMWGFGRRRQGAAGE